MPAAAISKLQYGQLRDAINSGAFDEAQESEAVELMLGYEDQVAAASADTYGPHQPKTSPFYRTPGAPETGQLISRQAGFDPEGAIEPFRRIPEGAGQAILRAGEGLGVVPENYRKNYESIVQARRDAFRAARGIEAGGAEDIALDVTGALIPVGGQAAAANAGRSLSYLWAASKAAVTGAALATTQYAEDKTSKWSQAGFGAAFPLAFQAVAGVGAGVRNLVAGAVERGEQFRTRVVRDAADTFFNRSRAVPEPSPYTLGQETGNPVIVSLENRARGPYLTDLNARQKDEAFRRFDELANLAERASVGRGHATGTRVVRQVNSTVDSLDQEMRRVKNEAWEVGMANVNRMAATSRTRVPLRGLRDEYERIMIEDANPFNFNGSVLPRGVREAFDTIDEVARTSGRPMEVYLPGVQTIMKGLGQDAPRGAAILSTADRRLEMYRQRLWRALNRDLDASGAITDPAFVELQRVRQGYAVASERLQRLEDDSINKLFGDSEAFANPAETLSRFYKLAPEDQTYAVQILQTRSPQTLQAMQSHRLKSALTAALEDNAAGSSRFNIDKFRTELFGGRDGLKDAPLWSGGLRNRMLSGVAHLRTILNNTKDFPSGASPVWPEEIAINIVSHTPGFMARLITRAAYGRYGDELLGTPEGIAALRTFANPASARSQAAGQAAAWIANLVEREEEENASAAPQE